MTIDNDSLDLLVILKAKDIGSVAVLRELMTIHANLSLQELGCLRFEAFESQTAAGTFIVVERWQSQAALDAHRQAKAITSVYVPKILPLVERELHLCSPLPTTLGLAG